MDERSRALVDTWIKTLGAERRASLYLLLDELCGGMDPSRHNPFGFLRLKAEFETSGELFGCSLEELRQALATSLGDALPRPERPPSALERLRSRVSRGGHPAFR